MCNKTKNEYNSFFKYCLQIFSIENILVEQKETCLKINGKQAVKLRRASIKFVNHFNHFSFVI